MERKELSKTLSYGSAQGVVAPEFIIRPNFLTSNSRYLRIF
ncbi:hypothetical protein LEP1GSC170_4888 [Leptospira interrogans serovar Bataviae str. HAI135]|nr:hypothetical protein LEP1GSC170_4888 [Leptospira interrogans serovar Bataviae str. HAI135]